MREILFRGKDSNTGEWRYFNLFDTDMHYVEHDTIGQYTGLQDCNGVEIYEGDILAYTILNKKYKCKVVWSGGSFRCIAENLPSQSLVEYLGINPDAKVIGNIYKKG